MNGANSQDLAKQEDIDGFLVGGASLKVGNFSPFLGSILVYFLKFTSLICSLQGPEFAKIVNSVTAKKVAIA